ncbi:MAG: ABC transporter permease [Sphingobacteriales bacterium 50-39]|nr:ABC transporter permease [Sphingobacteriales bacterium]OJW58553.1 MAG: ABC transporter permease [Sphingobacteriales bacterium 50-39]
MLKNYLKVAFRNLWKNRGFSLINITGLAIGMASAMLIMLWIQSEVSYEQFHEKKDRIYEAWNKAVFSGEMHCWNTTPKIMASALKRDLPEVEHACRVNWSQNYLFSIGDKRIMAQGNAVDSIFLQVFTFPLVKGDANTALMEPFSVVLTESFAKSLFGNDNPIGKTVKIDDKDYFKVTGVAKDPPINSRFTFKYLIPWSYVRKIGDDDNEWGNNSTRTYVLLKENATLASVAPKVKGLKMRYDSSEKHWENFLYPISRWRLYSSFKGGVEEGGKIEFVRLFGIIAAFILLIACINFMNLSTARSEKRAKEVGIRKVVGAQRGSLISQFIGESILLALIAGIIAVGIVQLSLPGFNQLTDKKLALRYGSPYFWLIGLAFIIFTGLLAGSYPAFFLSSFQPVKVLKGTFRAVNALVTPRKVLVVLQFSFAIILIICTIIVKQQIDHARDREIGYDKANLVYHFMTGDVGKNYDLIKRELLSSGAAVSVCKTSSPLTQGWSDSWGFQWEGKAADDKTDFDRFCSDQGLVSTAGLKLAMGRDFNLKDYPTDSTGVLLNESAAKAMGFKNPLGKIVKDNNIDWHVVGVIKDFVLQSPYQPTHPMVIEGARLQWFNTVTMRLNDANTTSQNLKKAEAIFKKYNPEFPFEYNFIDDEYARKFDDEKRTGTLAALFAGLTIFISCLGLFGLATYMAENRVKEIGVRKVLGASVTGIVSLLSKDFLRLVIIAFFIAAPISWWAMYKWLQGYPYRVSIQWWVFMLAALLSMGIALLTVSYQALRAALSNPARSLRSE